MGQKMRFGMVGNTEKKCANYEQLLRAGFSCFQGQKDIKKIYCSTKKLPNITFIYFFGSNML